MSIEGLSSGSDKQFNPDEISLRAGEVIMHMRAAHGDNEKDWDTQAIMESIDSLGEEDSDFRQKVYERVKEEIAGTKDFDWHAK